MNGRDDCACHHQSCSKCPFRRHCGYFKYQARRAMKSRNMSPTPTSGRDLPDVHNREPIADALNVASSRPTPERLAEQQVCQPFPVNPMRLAVRAGPQCQRIRFQKGRMVSVPPCGSEHFSKTKPARAAARAKPICPTDADLPDVSFAFAAAVETV
jgi:hypothetical protein